MTRATTGAQIALPEPTEEERQAQIKRDIQAGRVPAIEWGNLTTDASRSVTGMSFAVEGAAAICTCSKGREERPLKAPPERRVFINDKPQLNCADSKPYVNIPCFGYCTSLANPDVEKATAANNGVLTEMPCTPTFQTPWIGLSPCGVIVEQERALLKDGVLVCMYGGQIQIQDDGQGSSAADAFDDNEALLLLYMAADAVLLSCKGNWKSQGDEAEKKAKETREQMGGTLTPEDDIEEARVLVGNGKILAAKQLYAKAEANPNEEERKRDFAAAEELSRIGREQMGGTITLDDDLVDARRMMANEYMFMALRMKQQADASGDAAKKREAVKLMEAAQQMGATISREHTVEEARKVVMAERSHTPSVYENNQGRTWNGIYDKTEWENQAQYLYGLTQQPGGSQWASSLLPFVEVMLYGSKAEAARAYEEYKEVIERKQQVAPTNGVDKNNNQPATASPAGKFEDGVQSAQDVINQDSNLNQEAVYIPNAGNFPLYGQADSRYANERLGKGDTMAQSGCLITGLAAVYAWNTYGHWANGVEPHPGRYKDRGSYNNGGALYWETLGLPMPLYENYNPNESQFESKVKNAIDKGYPVLIAVNGSSHWMIVIGYKSDGAVIIYDTANGSVGTFNEINKKRKENGKSQYTSVSRYYEFTLEEKGIK